MCSHSNLTLLAEMAHFAATSDTLMYFILLFNNIATLQKYKYYSDFYCFRNKIRFYNSGTDLGCGIFIQPIITLITHHKKTALFH